MASFFNLTLDTLGPEGVSISLNDNAQFTSSIDVTLKISLSDTDTTGYQVKVWGVSGAEEETDATWATFSATKSIQLTSEDGLKTVSVKVRDDVGNESATTTATITLNLSAPVITINGPDKSKISKIDGYNKSIFTFAADTPFVEYKVCVVSTTNATQETGVVIPTTNGSVNTSGTGEYPAEETISVTIAGADLETASVGDGVKIVKVFVKNNSGLWSVV